MQLIEVTIDSLAAVGAATGDLRRGHDAGQRRMPVCPTEYRPGCGQTQSPCGWIPTGIFVTAPVVVSNT